TGRRAGFITRTADYYRGVWRALIDAELATLWLAEHEDQPIDGAMTWRCGDREVYQYGATNDAGRKTYAAYGLLWRCIIEARARGARRFDFGGIPADPTDAADPMHGPYVFKKGFGGALTRWVGAHDAVPRGLAYRAFLLLEPACPSRPGSRPAPPRRSTSSSPVTGARPRPGSAPRRLSSCRSSAVSCSSPAGRGASSKPPPTLSP